ncbi:ribbon-helix-helix domain-containing protein [Candidatus Bathyarchaeota archaeon]|nr:ribbon-helix-helix domain-containing protein [Candidatus Bathyarchaeota archaeon]
MIPEYQGRIAFRLSPGDRAKIEHLIKAGKFKNLSQVIRAALKEFLKTA